jgi:hypothetical protein
VSSQPASPRALAAYDQVRRARVAKLVEAASPSEAGLLCGHAGQAAIEVGRSRRPCHTGHNSAARAVTDRAAAYRAAPSLSRGGVGAGGSVGGGRWIGAVRRITTSEAATGLAGHRQAGA